MSQHEGRYAAGRLLTALGLIAAVIWFGNAQAASTAAATGAAVVRQDENEPPICRHDDLSQWYCPDTAGRFSWIGDKADVASVRLTITRMNGRSRTVNFPRGTDAVFLSKFAVDNFLTRYYDATDRVKARDVRSYVALHSRVK